MNFDPEFFNKNLLSNGNDKLRECPDCRRKEGKINDYESRIKDLTDYIKNNTDRLGNEKKKYEDEIQRVNLQN